MAEPDAKRVQGNLLPVQDPALSRDPDHVYWLEIPAVGKVPAPVSVTGLVDAPWPPFDPQAALAGIRKRNKRNHYRKMSDAEILTSWETSNAEARDAGTRFHAAIEAFLHPGWSCGEDEFAVEMDMARAFVRDHITSKGRVIVALERMISMRIGDLFLPGTVDLIFYDPATGLHGIVDWKRTNKWADDTGYKGGVTPGFKTVKDSMRVKHSLQLHLYAEILERSYGVRVDRNELWDVYCHPKNITREYHAESAYNTQRLVVEELIGKFVVYKELACAQKK